MVVCFSSLICCKAKDNVTQNDFVFVDWNCKETLDFEGRRFEHLIQISGAPEVQLRCFCAPALEKWWFAHWKFIYVPGTHTASWKVQKKVLLTDIFENRLNGCFWPKLPQSAEWFEHLYRATTLVVENIGPSSNSVQFSFNFFIKRSGINIIIFGNMLKYKLKKLGGN